MNKKYINGIRLTNPIEKSSYLNDLPVVRFLAKKGEIPFTKDVTFLWGKMVRESLRSWKQLQLLPGLMQKAVLAILIFQRKIPTHNCIAISRCRKLCIQKMVFSYEQRVFIMPSVI